MTKSKVASATSIFYVGSLLTTTVALVIGFSGCAVPSATTSTEAVRNPKDTVVRVEAIERGASDNTHPFHISAAALRQTLEKLTVKGSLSRDAHPVFASDELADIAPKLASALEKAGPREDVIFTSASNRGPFRTYSPKTITSGRVFVHGSRLNVIFGVMHDPANKNLWDNPAAAPALPAGSRRARVEGDWSLVADGGHLTDKRSDWVVLDIAAAPTVATPPVATPAPATPGKTESLSSPAPMAPTAAPKAPTAATPDDRVHAVQERLHVLERLKARGLITDEEYRERRRAILQGI